MLGELKESGEQDAHLLYLARLGSARDGSIRGRGTVDSARERDAAELKSLQESIVSRGLTRYSEDEN